MATTTPKSILVEKESATPALVNLTVDAPDAPIKKSANLVLPPTTTEAEDDTTEGQRRINLLWEWTQAIIAIAVVMTTMASGVYSIIHQNAQVPTIISVAFGTVIGFYFARTNHQAIGGVGSKPTQDYIGR